MWHFIKLQIEQEIINNTGADKYLLNFIIVVYILIIQSMTPYFLCIFKNKKCVTDVNCS